MTQHIVVEIKCPQCGRRSTIADERIPPKDVVVTCHDCSHRFALNKVQQLNCHRLGIDSETDNDPGGWVVEHPACEGITYTINAVGGLIRSGMVSTRTRILPPGAPKYYEARELNQLRKFFEQKIRLNKIHKEKTQA